MRILFRKLPIQLVCIFLVTALSMGSYEILKELYFKGQLTLWESHIITIFVTATSSMIAAFFMSHLARKLVNTAQESQFKVQSIMENLFDAIIIIDKFGIIEMVNPAAEKIFGYDSKKLIGHNVKILMPEPHSSNHNGYLDNYLTTKIPKIIGHVRQRVQGIHSDGTVIPIDLVVNEMLHHNQVAFIATIRDVTKENRINLEMRQLRETEKKMLKHLKDELQMASHIQANMLPTKFLLYPECKEIEVFASMTPANEIGGDFYDVFLMNAEKVFIAVGDVTGKGVCAALHMTECMAHLHMIAARESKPHKILQKLNNRLCENNGSGMYITLCCGIFNMVTGEFVYSSAGHSPPLTNKDTKRFEFMPMPSSIVLGFVKDAKYKSVALQLNPGDSVFLYTDGVTDATNKQQDLFCDERLLETLSTLNEASPKVIIEHVKNEIETFAHEVDQADDITMLCFRYLRPLNPSMS